MKLLIFILFLSRVCVRSYYCGAKQTFILADCPTINIGDLLATKYFVQYATASCWYSDCGYMYYKVLSCTLPGVLNLVAINGNQALTYYDSVWAHDGLVMTYTIQAAHYYGQYSFCFGEPNYGDYIFTVTKSTTLVFDCNDASFTFSIPRLNVQQMQTASSSGVPVWPQTLPSKCGSLSSPTIVSVTGGAGPFVSLDLSGGVNVIKVTASPDLSLQPGSSYVVNIEQHLALYPTVTYTFAMPMTVTTCQTTLTTSVTPTTQTHLLRGVTALTSWSFNAATTSQANYAYCNYIITYSVSIPPAWATVVIASPSSLNEPNLNLDITTTDVTFIGTNTILVTANAVDQWGVIQFTTVNTLTLILKDPCDATVLSFSSGMSDMQTKVLEASVQSQSTPVVTDTVSQAKNPSGLGNDLCTTRTYSISTVPIANSSPTSTTPTQLPASLLTINSSGVVTSATIPLWSYLGQHQVTVKVAFSATQFATTTFVFLIQDCEVLTLTIATLPVVQQYTVTDPTKTFSFQQSHVVQAPACGYVYQITLDGLPSSCTSVTGTTTKSVSVYSMLRSDVDVKSINVQWTKPATYLWSTWPDETFTFNLEIIDPCLKTVISSFVIKPLIAFQGYKDSSSSSYTFTDSESERIKSVYPAVLEFCGAKSFEFKLNDIDTEILSFNNTDRIYLNPQFDTEAGQGLATLTVSLIEVPTITLAINFTVTVITYWTKHIATITYTVGTGTKAQEIQKFEYLPSVVKSSGITFHTIAKAGDLSTPLDITTLTPIDESIFSFDKATSTFKIATSQDQTTPVVCIVMIDSTEDWPNVVPYEYFYVRFQDAPLIPGLKNTAPTFVPSLPKKVFINSCKDDPSTYWQLQLPSIEDAEGDEIKQIKVSIPSTLIQYDENKQNLAQIAFSIEKATVTIAIELCDVNNKCTDYKLGVTFDCDSGNLKNASTSGQAEVLQSNLTAPTAKIQSVSATGLLTIKFSAAFAVPDRPQDIRNTTIQINETVYPAMLVSIVPGYYSDPSLLGMNWTYVNYTEEALLIQLGLDNPLVISSIISDPDSVAITIYGQAFFMQKNGAFIDFGYQLQNYTLPRMTTAAAAASAQASGASSKTGATSVLVSSTVVNLLMAGPLQQVLGAIKSTQILTHLLLINVATPASASLFFGQLMSLITLQFFDLTDSFNSVLVLDEEDKALNGQFEILGYQSMYVLVNLGTVCLGIFCPVILWLIIFAVIEYLLPKYNKFKQKVSQMLFFDRSFEFINETYILLAMCSSINFHYYNWDTHGNRVNSLFATLLFAVVVAFPAVIAWIYQSKINFKYVYYKERKFMQQFGSLTKHLAVFREGRKVFTYVWVGLLRKLSLVLMLVFMQDYVLWSLFCVNYHAIIMIVVLGYTRPFNRVSMVYLELMNEFATLILNYHLMCFTDWVSDVNTREIVGDSLVYTTCINLGINFMLIARQSGILVYTKCKLHYLKYKSLKKWESERAAREKARRRLKVKQMLEVEEKLEEKRQLHLSKLPVTQQLTVDTKPYIPTSNWRTDWKLSPAQLQKKPTRVGIANHRRPPQLAQKSGGQSLLNFDIEQLDLSHLYREPLGQIIEQHDLSHLYREPLGQIIEQHDLSHLYREPLGQIIEQHDLSHLQREPQSQAQMPQLSDISEVSEVNSERQDSEIDQTSVANTKDLRNGPKNSIFRIDY